MKKTVQDMSGKRKKESKFVNPFTPGVTYEQFIDSMPDNVKLEDYLKGKCEPEQIAWLKEELTKFKNK
jgi:hypothetical protein